MCSAQHSSNGPQSTVECAQTVAVSICLVRKAATISRRASPAEEVFASMENEKVAAAHEHCVKLWRQYIVRDAPLIRVSDGDLEDSEEVV